MSREKRGYLRVILSVIIVLIVGGLALNWFLTNRLETYLREKLSSIVSNNTGGFYKLDFQELKIGLYTGELELKGIDFRPDSLVFAQWKTNDSLPQTYLNFKIDKIHFKGLNLTWRFSYKKLNFELFEIEKPVVVLYNSEYSSNYEQKIVKNRSVQNLHEFIAPYIDVLTVKQLNLENASIEYFVEDKQSPSVFALKDISFHASNFVLNENSSQSGKLLYCDNIDFTTNKAQTLLRNEQFSLKVDLIGLNTKDSIIRIQDVRFIPQQEFWESIKKVPEDYLDARVKEMTLRGAYFSRLEGNNYLDARSFDVNQSDIEYFNIKTTHAAEVKKDLTDSVSLSWTLYAIVSPLLKRITIDKISINNAQLAYSVIDTKIKDIYRLNKFDFTAYRFQVDSLADQQKKFLYSESFNLKAADIQGQIVSKNHVFNIDNMLLNMPDSLLIISGIKLRPLTVNTRLDYLDGKVDSVRITGLYYDKGLRTDSLIVDSPDVKYVKMPQQAKERMVIKETDTLYVKSGKEAVTTLDLITPYLGYLAVRQININKGNVVFEDRRSKDHQIYKLPNIDLEAADIRIDRKTISSLDTYCSYDYFKIKFEKFDNLLPGKDYRLQVDRGVYDGVQGNLLLNNIHLIPQKHLWTKSSDNYIQLSAPYIYLKGVYYNESTVDSQFGFDLFDAASLKLRVVKARETLPESEKKESEHKNLSIKLGAINIKSADINYEDQVQKKNILASINRFNIKSLSWNAGNLLSVDNLLLESPNIKIKETLVHKKERAKSGNNIFAQELFKGIRLGSVQMNDGKFILEQPDRFLSVDTYSTRVSKLNLESSFLNVDQIYIGKPNIKYHKSIDRKGVQPVLVDSLKNRKVEDFVYRGLAGLTPQLHVGVFKIEQAKIDYVGLISNKPIMEQQVSETDFDLSGLTFDQDRALLDIKDFNFRTKNLSYPLDEGFYTLKIGELDMHKRNAGLKLKGLQLKAAYPKEEFAYKHPHHKDWFDVSVSEIDVSNIDYPGYFKNRILNIQQAQIKNIRLLNLKNQKIEVEHNKMPMIYEGLQKLPLKLNIDSVDVRNFYVDYQELPKKGTEIANIFFSDMNGRLKGVTNIVSYPQQYIRLDADGKLMGTGHFDATWYIPVDSLNDRFLITARMQEFDLRELNRLIMPMAPVEIQGGIVKGLIFKTEASSVGAKIQMQMPYQGLRLALYKNKEGELIQHKLGSDLVNLVLKKDNPDKRKKEPRIPFVEVKRDPYHSTFNYLWQILQPPIIESVGISQQRQDFLKKIAAFTTRIKNIFRKKKKEDTQTN